MAKGPTFNTITAAFTSASKLNANNALIVTAFDNTISRDGSTPNTMTADLDMNGNDLLNVGVINTTDVVDLDTTRAVLATLTVASVIDLIRTSGYTTIGDGGGATYKRVGSEPSHALKVQSADGAWWELVPDHGYVNVRQAGATGDDVTDDSQAFLDALAFADWNPTSELTATNTVIVPPGSYYMATTTLELKKTVHLVGQSVGQAGGLASKMHWDANITAIIVHTDTTIGVTTEVDASTLSGAGSRLQGLWLHSAGGTIAGVSDQLKGHGIWLRARATIQDVTITSFPGNGIHISATAGGGGASEGNANNWVVERVTITQCHLNGIFVDGADVNAGYCIGADCSKNGRWGIYDSSFLGNTYIGNHAATNGLATIGENGAGESSYVEHSGNLYAANALASEADFVATTPGTDDDIWFLIGAGSASSTIPAWASAQAAGTYFLGGPYRSDNANARNVFTGNYSESGQGPSQFVRPTLVFGGTIQGTKGTAVVHRDDDILGSVFYHNHETSNFAPDRDLTLVFNPVANRLLRFNAGGDHAGGLGLCTWDETNGQMIIGEFQSTGTGPINITTTSLNVAKYGRDAVVGGGNIGCHKGIFLGKDINSARHITTSATKPTTGDRAKGEVVINNNAGIGGAWGWYCTTGSASTPTFTTVYGIGTQQSNIVDADVSHALNATFSDTEVESALDALGVKINSLIAVLEHFGFAST